MPQEQQEREELRECDAMQRESQRQQSLIRQALGEELRGYALMCRLAEVRLLRHEREEEEREQARQQLQQQEQARQQLEREHLSHLERLQREMQRRQDISKLKERERIHEREELEAALQQSLQKEQRRGSCAGAIPSRN
jgi:hypothetical protein